MAVALRWYIGRSRARSWGAFSVVLLALYAALVASEARSAGVSFDAIEPWPLAGPGPRLPLAIAALALGLGLGWLIPGLALASLGGRPPRGGLLLARAFGLGVGYILLSSLVVALAAGRAPSRMELIVALALPAVAAWLVPRSSHGPSRDRTPLLAALAMILVTALLWPKLAHEALNGDGTEAYELARSLDEHPLPRWDLERPAGPGRYGHPAVNPFLTNSFLVHAQMAVLGRGELAARLPFPVALVLAAFLAATLSGRAGASVVAYAAGLAAVAALWNAFYVGHELALADLAEPGSTDLLMTALWLAGACELARGSVTLASAFLLLATGVLYSAPLLAGAALVTLAAGGDERGRRALWLFLAGFVLAVGAALGVGAATDSLPDWLRQIRSEYWQDFVDGSRREPTAPLLARLLLMTGALPLVAALRFRTLSAVPRALLVAGGLYLALVATGAAKNLHYLTPLPFLFAPAALEASGPRWRTGAGIGLAAVLALSWPRPLAIQRDSISLGRRSCLDGVDLERAALAGDVVYAAFARPGATERFAVGKHTFVRYAHDRAGEECRFRLSPTERDGWLTLAGATLTFSVRDMDEYVRWRFARPALPSSPLFRRTQPEPLPASAEGWIGQHRLWASPGQALLLDGFARVESSEPGNPPAYVTPRSAAARLLVPLPARHLIRLRAWAPEGGLALTLRVNGGPASRWHVPPGWGEVKLADEAELWRTGWNLVQLASGDAPLARLALDRLNVATTGPR